MKFNQIYDNINNEYLNAVRDRSFKNMTQLKVDSDTKSQKLTRHVAVRKVPRSQYAHFCLPKL